MHLSLSMMLGGRAPNSGGGVPWYTSEFDLDYENARFRVLGETFPTIAEVAAGKGWTASEQSLTTATYVDPTAANLLTNGDFATDVAGYTAFNSGSIAWSTGRCELTAAGNLSGFAQSIAGLQNRAFRFRATGYKGTTVASLLMLGASSSVLNSASGFATQTGTTPAVFDAFISGYATTYFGWRNSSASGSGTSYHDDMSVVEVWPFEGWNPGADTLVVDFTTPAAASGNKVVWQADNDTERSRLRLVWDASANLRFIVTNEISETLNFLLGNVPVLTRAEVAISMTAGAWRLSLNGAQPTVSPNTSYPGSAKVRVGRSFTGEAFDGVINRLRIIPAASSLLKVGFYSSGRLARLQMDGDSYTDSATRDLKTSLRTLGVVVVAGGVSGSTMEQISERVQSEPDLKALPLCIWDGRHTGWGSLSAYMAELTAAYAGRTGPTLYIPPMAVSSDTVDYIAETVAIRDAALALLGAGNVIDWRDHLVVTGNTVADAERFDATHLTSAAMDKMAVPVKAWFDAL